MVNTYDTYRSHYTRAYVVEIGSKLSNFFFSVVQLGCLMKYFRSAPTNCSVISFKKLRLLSADNGLMTFVRNGTEVI